MVKQVAESGNLSTKWWTRQAGLWAGSGAVDLVGEVVGHIKELGAGDLGGKAAGWARQAWL